MYREILEIVIPVILIVLLLLAYFRLRLKRLKSTISPLLGKIEVLQKYNGEKVLTINNYIQGISTEQEDIQQSYWYKVAFEAVKGVKDKPNPKILMLGLGANTISNLIARLNPKVHQTIVEFDPLIVRVCQEFFGLDSLKNHKIIQADVFKLAEKKVFFKQQFDCLIVDVFTGNPPYIALKSNQPTFIEKIIRWLKKDGVIIFNRPAHNEQARQDSIKLKDYLQNYFKETALFDIKDPRGYRNHIITAKGKVI